MPHNKAFHSKGSALLHGLRTCCPSAVLSCFSGGTCCCCGVCDCAPASFSILLCYWSHVTALPGVILHAEDVVPAFSHTLGRCITQTVIIKRLKKQIGLRCATAAVLLLMVLQKCNRRT